MNEQRGKMWTEIEITSTQECGVKMKTARDKTKKKYLERWWDEKMELQRTVHENKGTRLERA